MQGIYKITNTTNGKAYIGASNNIERRWSDHRFRYNAPGKEYEKALYRAMRKYGIEFFVLEVLEECDDFEQRSEREKYYIQKHKTYYEGYNETFGGDGVSGLVGEQHGKVILSEKDVIDIRTRYANRERCKVVYEDYKGIVSRSGFAKVWNGQNWPHVMTDIYTKENIEFHTHNTGQVGEENGRAKLTAQDVRDIRLRVKNGEQPSVIYKDYEHLKLNKEYFSMMANGHNWKHIVV